jgi:hypothetical protein
MKPSVYCDARLPGNQIVRLRCGDNWFAIDEAWLAGQPGGAQLTYYKDGGCAYGSSSSWPKCMQYTSWFASHSFAKYVLPGGRLACCPNDMCVFLEKSTSATGGSSASFYPNGVYMYARAEFTDAMKDGNGNACYGGNKFIQGTPSDYNLVSTQTQPDYTTFKEITSGVAAAYSCSGDVILTKADGSEINKGKITYFNAQSSGTAYLATPTISVNGGEKITFLADNGQSKIEVTMTEVVTGCTTPSGVKIATSSVGCDGNAKYTCNGANVLSLPTNCDSICNSNGVCQTCNNGACNYNGCDTKTSLGYLAPGAAECLGSTGYICSTSKLLSTKPCNVNTESCLKDGYGGTTCKPKGCTINGKFYAPNTYECDGTYMAGCTAAEASVDKDCADEGLVCSSTGTCVSPTTIQVNGMTVEDGDDADPVEVEGKVAVRVVLASGTTSSGSVKVTAEIQDSSGKLYGSVVGGSSQLLTRSLSLVAPISPGSYYVVVKVGGNEPISIRIPVTGEIEITLSTCNSQGSQCADTQKGNDEIFVRAEVRMNNKEVTVTSYDWDASMLYSGKEIAESQGLIRNDEKGGGVVEGYFTVPNVEDVLTVRFKARVGSVESGWSEEKSVEVTKGEAEIKLLQSCVTVSNCPTLFKQASGLCCYLLPDYLPIGSYPVKFSIETPQGESVAVRGFDAATINGQDITQQIDENADGTYTFTYTYPTANVYTLMMTADTEMGPVSLNGVKGAIFNIMGETPIGSNWWMYVVGGLVLAAIGYMVYSLRGKK